MSHHIVICINSLSSGWMKSEAVLPHVNNTGTVISQQKRKSNGVVSRPIEESAAAIQFDILCQPDTSIDFKGGAGQNFG